MKFSSFFICNVVILINLILPLKSAKPDETEKENCEDL